MRILASNPDTIGDVVLRQPLYRALVDAGHELTLIVRPLVVPILGAIVPGARVISCGVNAYDPGLHVGAPALATIVEAARVAEPDLLLIPSYQWTVLEETLSAAFEGTPCVALSGKSFADQAQGPLRPSRLRITRVVQATEESPEVRKNELLAAEVLGAAVKLGDPRVVLDRAHLAASEPVLARLGLEPGRYWVACVGESEYTQVRNWPLERWADVLATWARRDGLRFLLVGQESEAKSLEAVRSAMTDQAGSASIWTGRGEGDLDVLLGLIGQSDGYVGRDTGPMHLAAAMSKPVLAVFGGGTWPRFLPQVDPSIAVAVGVPCVGCGWSCHLPRSYCIKDVPTAEVTAAMSELRGGAIRTRTTRLLKPDQELLVRIAREGAASARERLTQVSVMRRQHIEQSDSLAAVLERALKQAGRAEALAEQMDAAAGEHAKKEALLRQRLAAAENSFRVREAELQRRLADLEANASKAERFIQSQAEHQAREADLLARLARAQEELASVSGELIQARAEASDSKLRLSKSQSDQGTLLTLSRQNEGEVVVLRRRLGELMASRWRRYGQRLGLCMTMPWEQEMTNGKH
jgi:heptosyltransferase-2